MEDNGQFASSRTPWLCRCWLFVIPILSSAMVVRGEAALSMPAESPDDGSLLCIGECSTCPVTCAPPSPPPPPDDRSLLCISKCDTCPVICTPPPPPPPPLSSPPPPSRATPPPSKPAPPAPEEGPRGGLSYPYYYFYTSEGMRCRLLHGILGLLPLLLTSLSLFLR